MLLKFSSNLFRKYVIILNTSKRSLYFLTTPIFYANSAPHIGHLYTAVIADALSRYEQIKSHRTNVHFMTGTDEHGLKIHRAAKLNNTPEQKYVDSVSEQYANLFHLYNVNFSDFLRTTQERHKKTTIHLWKTLSAADHIYKGEYSGWYCVADEAFVPNQLINVGEDGSRSTVEGNRPVEFVKEINYKFRLRSFQNDLLQWLRRDRIYPSKFQRILVDWIEEGSVLEDISVSRPRARVPWGIPVPNDSDHTIYVWLDALSCYLTSAGYPENVKVWPPDVQIIGKDILKFHGVFWPAFLMGAGLEPPKKLLCHSHWIINGEKMSKSKGNVIDPVTEAEKYNSEGFRYFLLREGVPHSDGNYSPVKIQRILNSELADTLGNLVNRCTGSLVNPRQTFPTVSRHNLEKYCMSEASVLMKSVEDLAGVVGSFYDNYEFYKGIDAIMATLRLANEFFERKKPWDLRKNAERSDELACVLHITLETLRVCGVLLYPIVPKLSSQLLTKIGIPEDERTIGHLSHLSWQNLTSTTKERSLSSEKVSLYPRLR